MKIINKYLIMNSLLILLLIFILGFLSYYFEFFQADFLVMLVNFKYEKEIILKLVKIAGILVVFQYVIKPIIVYTIKLIRQKIVLNSRRIQYKNFIKKMSIIEHEDLYNNKTANDLDYIYKNLDSYSGLILSLIEMFESLIILIFYVVIICKVDFLTFIISMIMFSILFIAKFLYAKKELNNQIDSVPEERKAEYFRDVLYDTKTSKEIKSYDAEEYFSELSNINFHISSKKRFYLRIKNAQFYDLVKLLTIFLPIMFLIIIYYTNKTINLEFYSMALLVSIFLKSFSLIDNLVEKTPDLYKHIYNVKKINEFNKKMVNKENKLEILKINKIEFKNVSYKYPNSNKIVVDNVNFIITQNESVSIIGENGAGKTTIIKLLLGLLKPNSGKILINDIELDKIDIKKYYDLFSVSMQDIVKIEGTLYDNIVLSSSKDNDTKQRFYDLIKTLNIDKVIDKLSDKENTILGKTIFKGQELSSGEWQKISIARAFMKKGYYILDEPTASIDPIEEGMLFDSLSNLTKNNKGILITHRIGFSRLNDTIFVVKKGKIVEKGNHNELISKDTIYRKMYNEQKNAYLGENHE